MVLGKFRKGISKSKKAVNSTRNERHRKKRDDENKLNTRQRQPNSDVVDMVQQSVVVASLSESDKTASAPLDFEQRSNEHDATNGGRNEVRGPVCASPSGSDASYEVERILRSDENGLNGAKESTVPQHITSLKDRRKKCSAITDDTSTHGSGNSSDGNLSNVPSPPRNASSIAAAYNSCKAELRDAKRDKRVYSAFYESEKAKNIELQKEKAQLSQRLTALEAVISKKGKRFKSRRTRFTNLQGVGAREKYHGVFMSLLHDINKDANLCVTESYLDEKTGYRIRNWTKTATIASPQTARKAGIFTFLPCGTHAIPHCPMQIALKKEFFTLPFESVTKFIEYRAKLLLNRPGFSFMTPTMKDDCLKVIAFDPELISRHRQSLSEAVSQRKKHAKNSYLKALGYNTVCIPVPAKGADPNEAARRLERKEIFEKCRLGGDGTIDTMYWRVSKWDDLRKSNIESVNLSNEMHNADQSANTNGNVDVLFSNEAARLAFQEFKGFDFPPSISSAIDCYDTSILTLARADAWMTTALDNIMLEGKGGKRNNIFTDSFQKLLPIALDSIINEVWNDIKSLALDELRVHVGIGAEDDNDPFGNYVRDHTVVFVSSNGNDLYLAVNPNYFKEKVCSSYGFVKDCIIGQCDRNGIEFTQISSTMYLEQMTGYETDESSKGSE